MYCSKKVIDLLKKLKIQLSIDSEDTGRSLVAKILDNKVYRTALGALAGGFAGFLYWRFIGCNTGSCPLTSNPYQSVIIFGFLGGFLAKDKKEKQINNSTKE